MPGRWRFSGVFWNRFQAPALSRNATLWIVKGRTSLRTWLLALVAWGAVVLLFSTRTEIRGEPFVWVSLSWTESFRIAVSQWTAWALLAVGIVWIDRRLPVEPTALAKRILWHLPLSFVFTVAYTYLNYAGLVLLDAPRDPSLLAGGLLPTAWRVIHRNTTFFYWVIVAFYLALDYQNHLKDRVIRTSELERLLSDARVETLRMQLRPHFLFNALNAISAYIEIKPRMARRMIEQLGDLLRLSLEHTDEQEIALERELAFTERYLDLQAVRFEDRLSISLEPERDVMHALVPSFILQPLVENAIKYGTSLQPNGGEVSVRAWRNNGRVCLSVSDNGPGLPAGWTLEQNAGIGLSNTRERLKRLYGDANHSFCVVPQPGGGVQVELSLPYREV